MYSHRLLLLLIVAAILFATTTTTTTTIDVVGEQPLHFLKNLRLERFYSKFEMLGVVYVEDYLLVTKEDLIDFGFKTVHIRKFEEAMGHLKNKVDDALITGRRQTSRSTNDIELSHATLLMKTKLRKMKIHTLKRKLNENNEPAISTSEYRKEVAELRESLHQMDLIASHFGLSKAFQDADMESLENAHKDGYLAVYLLELKDLQELKVVMDDVLDNSNILTIESLRSPEMLQTILDDQEERNKGRNRREQKAKATKAKAKAKAAARFKEEREMCAPTADWRQCGSVGSVGIMQAEEGSTSSSSSSSSSSKFYTYQKFNDQTDLSYRKAEAHFQLGHMLHQEGELDAAKEEYELCLTFAPTHVTARHMLNVVLSALVSSIQQEENDGALMEEEDYDRAQPGYVEMLFDSYASTYNEHMVDKLLYQVPHVLVEEIMRETQELSQKLSKQDVVFPTTSSFIRLLDLGCGTGLVGKLWKEQNDVATTPTSTYFVGVDMSSSMLEMSPSGVYDRMVHSTIDEYFESIRARAREEGDGIATTMKIERKIFDFVTVGDVFGYIGNVESVLRGASHVLRESSGRLLFTVETSDSDIGPRGYRLDVKTSRFTHDVLHLRKLIKKVGLIIRKERAITLRYQMRMPVKGMLFVCEKMEVGKVSATMKN